MTDNDNQSGSQAGNQAGNQAAGAAPGGSAPRGRAASAGRAAAGFAAGKALGSVTGTAGAADLFAASRSDGTVTGDARELAGHTKAGAEIGAKLGSAPGAAIGAAVGAGLAAVKNKKLRRRVLLTACIPMLCFAITVAVVNQLVASLVHQARTREQQVNTAAAADGLSADDISAYQAAAYASGVQWTVLAAVDRSAGAWSGPGTPPYGIDNLSAINTDLTAHDLTPLTAAQPADRVAAGYALGRLLAAKIRQADPDVDPGRVDAGAGVVVDPGQNGQDGQTGQQVIGVVADDADSVGLHAAAQQAFVAAIADLPATTSGDAQAIFDTAYQWTVGQTRSCSALDSPLLDSDLPVPSGAGARLDARIASWNVYYHSKTAQTAAGLRAVAQHADVIGLQEFGPSSKKRAVFRALPAGWANWTTTGNMTGIVWQSTKYQLLRRGVVKNIGYVHVEDGASGEALGPRYTLWVTLRQRSTGAVFTLINIHIVPTIDRGGRPDPSRPTRVALYKQQIQQLIQLTNTMKASNPVFVTGDFNVDAKADARVKDPSWPLTQLQAAGLYSNWRSLGYPGRGTHAGGRDGRWIDYVWATTDQAAPTTQQILGKSGSDHSAVVVTESSAGRGSNAGSKSGSTAANPGSPSAPSAGPGSASAPVDLAANLGPANLPAQLVTPGATLSGEQISNAAVIIAAGKAAQIPAQGWVVALAAALQESGLRNLNYGDRDSIGLFQQRPSSGWGSVQQIMDPRLSAQAFYGVAAHTRNRGLVDIPGWQQMSVADAAQAVQVSAFPSAYAKHEATARSIVQQLDGTVTVGSAALAGTTGSTTACTGAPALGAAAAMPPIGTGPCPLDALHAQGKSNPAGCNAALSYMQQQIDNGSTSWRRRCLALVALAYGWAYSGTATAYEASQDVAAAGLLSTDRSNIPRGALMWWDGRAVGNAAGHVAIYDGNGNILSNDVAGPGRVGRVPWTVPEQNWHQRWLGWSPPYFPHGGGTSPAAQLNREVR